MVEAGRETVTHDLTNLVDSRDHCQWCPAYAESDHASLNTTEVTLRQQLQCLLRKADHNDLTSAVDLWVQRPRCGISLGCGRR